MLGAKLRKSSRRLNLRLILWCGLFLVLGFILGSASSSPRQEQYTAEIRIDAQSLQVQPDGSRNVARDAVFKRSDLQQQQMQMPEQAESEHAASLYVATAANAAYFGGLTNVVGSLRFW
jgi:hypothetical protein